MGRVRRGHRWCLAVGGAGALALVLLAGSAAHAAAASPASCPPVIVPELPITPALVLLVALTSLVLARRLRSAAAFPMAALALVLGAHLGMTVAGTHPGVVLTQAAAAAPADPCAASGGSGGQNGSSGGVAGATATNPTLTSPPAAGSPLTLGVGVALALSGVVLVTVGARLQRNR